MAGARSNEQVHDHSGYHPSGDRVMERIHVAFDRHEL